MSKQTSAIRPGTLIDQAKFAQSFLVDVPRDVAWFKKHPDVDYREREPTPLEQAAVLLPKGSRVVVARGVDDDSTFRHLFAPVQPDGTLQAVGSFGSWYLR